jgi:hypothetical protein
MRIGKKTRLEEKQLEEENQRKAKQHFCLQATSFSKLSLLLQTTKAKIILKQNKKDSAIDFVSDSAKNSVKEKLCFAKKVKQ